jgi:hypothetical protein
MGFGGDYQSTRQSLTDMFTELRAAKIIPS